MNKNSKIYIAGHTGLVGSALHRTLLKNGFNNIIRRNKHELDLLDQAAVSLFFKEQKPEYVFLAAAKVGGIMANSSKPAEFAYQNLQIQNNIIHHAYLNNVKKLLFLGSSCIYPRDCPQPIKEEYLLTGPLEKTNQAYAVAKIAGITLCQSYNSQFGTNFISVMPTNLYGPNDNFDPQNSHVLPAMIRKFHEAKINNTDSITLWGTGNPKREFLYVNDLADACLYLMNHYNSSDLINIGTGMDITTRELAELVKQIVGYRGTIVWDNGKPDGTPRKLLDVSRIKNLGWTHKTRLKIGIQKTYDYYKEII